MGNQLYFHTIYDIIRKNVWRGIMARFFLTVDELCADRIALTGDNAAHAKVLRLKRGNRYWHVMAVAMNACAA